MREQLKKADLIGLVFIAATIIAYSVRGIWSIYQTIGLVVGAALVIASLSLKTGEIRAGLGRRSTRFGINSATSVLLIIGVLAMVNYLGAQHQKRVDMTTEKIYSLSDESVKVADQVNQDLHILAFYPGGDYQPAKDLLDLFKNRNHKISYEFVDPDKQPMLAQQFQVTAYGDFQNPMSGETFRYGTLIFKMGDKTERVEKQSEPLREEDVTNTLMKIEKGEKKTIYFTQGHGERKIDDTDRNGFSQANADLGKENYTIKSVNLVTENKIPDDATVIVVAGPTAEFFPNEIEMLNNYLKGGGSGLIMLDPKGASLKDLTSQWSIDVGNNIVVDPSGIGRLLGMGPAAPVVGSYGTHPITERMRVMTFFPLARSVTPAEKPAEGIVVDKLIQTNDKAWGETNLKGNEAEYNEGQDLKGPVTLGVAITKDEGQNKKTRLVVYGNSAFASNAYYAQAGNGNLFTNTLNWLARDENFISIKPKAPDDRRLEMTEAQGRLVSYVMVLLLPVGVLLSGVSVWMKRRK
jgi:ABC-type uncharacterized transport system involved in gliding motility auxiliary subunit